MSSFGVSKTLKYYEFPLDSYDGSQPYASGISKLDWPIFQVGGKRPLQNIAGVKILEAQIPFSWYTLNSSNNTFILQEAGGVNTTDQTVTMTWSLIGQPLVPAVGNYTADQFVGPSGLLTNSLNYTSALAGNNTTFNSSYNLSTQKIEIWNSVLSPVNGKVFTLKFGNAQDSGDLNPRLLLGFDGGSNPSTAWNLTVGNYMVAPLVAQTTGPNYVYLNSQKLGNLTDMYLPKGASNLNGGNSGPQMCKIPVNVDPGMIIYWQDPDPQKYFDFENLENLSEIDFYLTLGNTSGETPLRLNGGNFSLKLALIENDLTLNSTHSSHTEDRVSKRVRFY